MPLHIDYRPDTFEEVFGNKVVVKKLRAILERKEDIPHAFLFIGPKGCGKTTFARLVKRALDVEGHDYCEMNSADYKRLSDARELLRTARLKAFKPNGKRLWLLDECHALDKTAQRCLLKLLEEPPEQSYFCLATTDPQYLLPPFKDRCHTFTLAPLSSVEMTELLQSVLISELGEDTFKKVPPEAIKAIVSASNGTPRTALIILDQIIDLPPGEMLEAVQHSTEAETEVIELCRALARGADWKTISTILNGLTGEDPESIRRITLAYCSKTLLSGHGKEIGQLQAYMVMDAFRAPMYDIGWPGVVMACYVASTAAREVK